MAAEVGKRKKFYFRPRTDIALIVEVLQRNPYKNGNAVYTAITEELRNSVEFHDVNKRTVQERVERLLKCFRSEQLPNMKRSGTEEEYDERQRLLQELSDLEREWATRKRPATPTASEVHKKTTKLHETVGRPMAMTLTVKEDPAEAGEAAAERDEKRNGRQEREAADDSDLPTGWDNLQGEDKQNIDIELPHAKVKEYSLAARWSTTLDFLYNKLGKEEESKKMALNVQKEELKIKREEIEVRKLEAANERMKIEAQQREEQRRAVIEEERRKEEREERKEMMDRQNRLLDAILQLIDATKK